MSLVGGDGSTRMRDEIERLKVIDRARLGNPVRCRDAIAPNPRNEQPSVGHQAIPPRLSLWAVMDRQHL